MSAAAAAAAAIAAAIATSFSASIASAAAAMGVQAWRAVRGPTIGSSEHDRIRAGKDVAGSCGGHG